MKPLLRKLFSPILNYFESGDEEYNYKASHRTILLVVGALFVVLSLISLVAALAAGTIGALIPFVVFFGAGVVCLAVGGLGNNRAISKIWGNKQ